MSLRSWIGVFGAAFMSKVLWSPAQAHPYHHHYHHYHYVRHYNGLLARPAAPASFSDHYAWGTYQDHFNEAGAERASGNHRQVIANPAGCPRTLSCGCVASLHTFGHIVSGLNLAWNWAVKFPRAMPGPGMAAVWHHHVFIIEQVLGGDRVIAYDGNSGRGHITQIHETSIRGAVIVDPRGGHYSSL
jgi:hypothetical protein